MTAYGMRLYKVTAHKSRATKDLPLDNLSSCGITVDAAQELSRSLKAIQGQLFVGKSEYLTGQSRPPSAAPTTARPYLRVTDVSIDRRRLDVVVEYGREGDYESIISSSTQLSEPMNDKATARRYRVIFLIPPSEHLSSWLVRPRGAPRPAKR